MLGSGKSVSRIAERLEIGPATFTRQFTNLYRKLGARNLIEALHTYQLSDSGSAR